MKRTITASKGRLSYGALRVALIIPNMVLGVPVGSTHQNLQGFNMFSSLLACKILEDQIDELEEQRFLGM